MKTARGVYLDLTESTYIINIGNYKLYFSSMFNLKRFMEQYGNYKLNCFNRIKKHLHIEPLSISNIEDLLIFNFYDKIEKRGFYITSIGGEKEWHSNILKVHINQPQKQSKN